MDVKVRCTISVPILNLTLCDDLRPQAEPNSCFAPSCRAELPETILAFINRWTRVRSGRKTVSLASCPALQIQL